MTARILVVDDVEFNVKLLDTKFKQEYYQVFTASNGKQAIEKTKEVQPDIILMDAMMPEMDGFEAIKIIKSMPDLVHIPIIMVTALNAQEDKVKGLEAGADDFLTKPINDHALMTRVKSLLRLKFMTDELRLRDETSRQFGLINPKSEGRDKIEGSNVLLIDDDIGQISKIKNKLGAQKVNVDVSSTYDQVIALGEKKDYTLIIVNTMLVDYDALLLCSQLRGHPTLRYLPILIIVDEHDERTLDKGLEMGVNDYLISPIDPNELLARCTTQIKRKKYQDELKEHFLNNIAQAIIDPLTNLYNRRYFETHISSMVSVAAQFSKELSLLMIDIDHFKHINDSYGHLSGDAILRELGQRIAGNLRAMDVCARYGGEEFVIVLNTIGLNDAKAIADRVRSLIADKPFEIPVNPWKITCTISIGVATLKPNDNLITLVTRADKCLYYAKEHGRNKTILETEIEQ